MTKRLTVSLLSAALCLQAQAPADEQRKAKREAEALHRGSSSVIATGTSIGATDQAARDRKKAAEAMYMIASATAGTNRLVTGKPFSAEATTETVQLLADGNRIVRHNTTKYFRDRNGRTRREQNIESFGPSTPVAPVRMIFISDPVARIDYVLDPAQKTVRKFGRLEIETSGKLAESSRGERQQLGKRTIEGLECIGTRQTTAIPSGRIGNEQQIITTSETWYAPSIEAVVHSMTSDPRFGQTIYSMRNVVLADPLASLFEPPDGYKVEFEENPGVMKKRVERP